MKRRSTALDDYQAAVERTIGGMPDAYHEPCYALGLVGEAGEVADLIKKRLYHDHPISTVKLVDELGDVLWYLAALASIYDVPLSTVANANIEKLIKRYPNGFTTADSIKRADVEGADGKMYGTKAEAVVLGGLRQSEYAASGCRCFDGDRPGHDCKSGDWMIGDDYNSFERGRE